jgi:hypothetical protein
MHEILSCLATHYFMVRHPQHMASLYLAQMMMISASELSSHSLRAFLCRCEQCKQAGFKRVRRGSTLAASQHHNVNGLLQVGYFPSPSLLHPLNLGSTTVSLQKQPYMLSEHACSRLAAGSKTRVRRKTTTPFNISTDREPDCL